MIDYTSAQARARAQAIRIARGEASPTTLATGKVCGNCGDWRNALTGVKTCLCMQSGRYMDETMSDDGCKLWSHSGTKRDEMIGEMRKRAALSAKEGTP